MITRCTCNHNESLSYTNKIILFIYICLLCTFTTLAIDTDYAPPDITAEPHDAYAFEDQIVTLNCAATGKPEPEYIWYKDGNEIAHTSSKYKRDGGNLIINKFDPADDVGKYYCMIVVKASSGKNLRLVTRTAEVTNAGKLFINLLPFTFTLLTFIDSYFKLENTLDRKFAEKVHNISLLTFCNFRMGKFYYQQKESIF